MVASDAIIWTVGGLVGSHALFDICRHIACIVPGETSVRRRWTCISLAENFIVPLRRVVVRGPCDDYTDVRLEETKRDRLIGDVGGIIMKNDNTKRVRFIVYI